MGKFDPFFIAWLTKQQASWFRQDTSAIFYGHLIHPSRLKKVSKLGNELDDVSMES